MHKTLTADKFHAHEVVENDSHDFGESDELFQMQKLHIATVLLVSSPREIKAKGIT